MTSAFSEQYMYISIAQTFHPLSVAAVTLSLSLSGAVLLRVKCHGCPSTSECVCVRIVTTITPDSTGYSKECRTTGLVPNQVTQYSIQNYMGMRLAMLDA